MAMATDRQQECGRLAFTSDEWGPVATCSEHGTVSITADGTGAGLLGSAVRTRQASCGCIRQDSIR